MKLNIAQLELLGVVWSLEYFKFYLIGQHFEILTDHQALISALQDRKHNKTYQSRLTRWLDRLLPFDFDIKHIPGSKMGLVDILSRNPSGVAPHVDQDDEQLVVAKIDNLIRGIEMKDMKALTNSTNQSRAFHLE